MSEFHKIFLTRYLWAWFCLSQMTVQTLCTSGFVDDVVFSHNAASGTESKMTLCFIEFARWRHWERSMMSKVALYCQYVRV